MLHMSPFKILALDAATLGMTIDSFPSVPLHQAWPLTAAANFCSNFVIATAGSEFDTGIIRADGSAVPIYKPSDLGGDLHKGIVGAEKSPMPSGRLFGNGSSPKANPPIQPPPPAPVVRKPHWLPRNPILNHFVIKRLRKEAAAKLL
jgi:hypothetical protein